MLSQRPEAGEEVPGRPDLCRGLRSGMVLGPNSTALLALCPGGVPGGDGGRPDPARPVCAEYYGVPFGLDYVFRTVARRRDYGAIDNYREDFPLWAGLETG